MFSEEHDCKIHAGAGVAVTPRGVLPRDSHEIPPTIGGGTQVADFTKGFSKGFGKGTYTQQLRRRNGGGQGDPDPLIRNKKNVHTPVDRYTQAISMLRNRGASSRVPWFSRALGF